MKRHVVLCVLGLGLCLRAAAAPRDEALARVYGQLGQPVPNAESLPITHFLERVVHDLSATQARTTHRRVLLVNHLHLIESPDVNAHNLTLKEPGQDSQENHIFITTGLIKALLDEPAGLPPAELAQHRAERLKLLVGVLAHELGHPVDAIGDFSLSTNYGWESSDQARELRADADGSALLRASHYPEDAIYAAKRFIEELDKKERGGNGTGAADLWDAGTADHPEIVANQTLNRLLLTHSRLDRGIGDTAAFEAAIATVSPADYHSASDLPAVRRDGFRPPATLEQAVESLRHYIDDKELEHGEDKQVPDDVRDELNRRVLALEDKLAERGTTPLPAKEQSDVLLAFKKLIEAVGAHFDHAAYWGPLLYDEDEIKSRLAPPGTVSYFAGHEPHSALLEKIPFFHSPAYLDMVKKLGGHGTILARAPENVVSRFLPPEEYFAYLPSQNFELKMKAEDVQRHLAHPEYYPGELPNEISDLRNLVDLPRDLAGGSLNFRMRLGAFLLQQAFLDQSDTNRYKLFLELATYGKNPADGYFPALAIAEGLEPAQLDSQRQKALDYLQAHPDLRETYRQAAEFLWARRAQISLLELARRGQVDWKLIAALTGHPEASAAEEAARAANDFVAHSPEYAGFANLMLASGARPEEYRGISPGQRELLLKMVGTPLDHFARTMLSRADPELLRGWYREAFRAQIAKVSGKPAIAALAEAHHGAVASLFDRPDSLWWDVPALRMWDIVAEEIDHSTLPEPEKKEWLKAAFQEFHPELHQRDGLAFTTTTWVADPEGAPAGAAARVLGILKKHGLSDGTAAGQLEAMRRARAEGLWRKMRDLSEMDHHFSSIDETFHSAYANALDALSGLLAGEIAGAGSVPGTDAEKMARLTHLAELLAPVASEGEDAGPFRIHHLEELQHAVVQAATPLQVSAEARRALFDHLASSGASPETDAYFRAHVLPFLGNGRAADLETILKSHRIFSRAFQAELAREVLEPELHSLEGKPVPSARLQALVEHVESLVPDRTEVRDAVLEDISWRLSLSKPGELNYVESHKSTNLRVLSPQLARWASIASQALGVMDDAGRQRLMEFLADPRHRPFTREMENDVRSALRKVVEHEQKSRGQEDAGLLRRIGQIVEQRLADYKQTLIQFAQDSTPTERIPIFDLILNLGDSTKGVAASPAAREKVAHELLGIQPGTGYDKALMTYLDLVPEQERSVTLAYLLAHHDQGPQSLLDFFLAFGGPGIRAGQQSVLWGLLPGHRAELTDLFDRARPQTRAEIIEFLARRFPGRHFTVKRRLGSATSLTAVEVEWKEPDGHGGMKTRTAAVLIRRPHALEQLRSQVAMGKEYLKRLRAQGLDAEARFLEPLLAAQEAQMKEELDFHKVGANLDRLRESVEGARGLGARIAAQSPGIQFRVPRVYHELGDQPDVLFLEVAGGQTLSRVTPALHDKVAEPLARLLAASLFHGPYQANPSPGNFMVQPNGDGATVWLIDGGQIGELGSHWLISDEASHFAELLQALEARDAHRILRASLALGLKLPPALSAAGLQNELGAALAHAPQFEGAARALLDTLGAHGLALDPRYTFTGGLKTILELMNSGVLPRARMEQVLAAAVRQELLSKPFAIGCGWLFGSGLAPQ